MSTPLLLHGDDLHRLPPSFITGRRGTARIDLARGEIRHIAFSPIEAFRSIQIQIPALSTHSQIYTNHGVHHVVLDADRSLKLTCVMAREQPWMALICDLQSHSESPVELTLKIDPNLDYIHKFQGRSPHTVDRSGQRVEITQPDHPELLAVIDSDLDMGSSASSIQNQGILSLPIHRSGVIRFGAGYRDQIRTELGDLDADRVQQELDQVIELEHQWIEHGAQLICPAPILNRFFQLSRSWFHKSIRRLPFGSPYSTDLEHNQEIDLVAASPDYHGVFANDCIQSAAEGMIVAPQLKDCYRQGLEALYFHAPNLGDQIPESIELIHGDRRLYYAPLRIGQHPEWIVSLAACVLWSGDRDLGEQLWPGVRWALRYFVDPWDVGLCVWDTSAYPEQPDTRGYQFGRVYAQAWWIWALDLGSELAGYLGYTWEQKQLKTLGERASAALETYFGRSDGYGSWLAESGELHPHQDHEMIIPIALGVAPRQRAERVIETISSPQMWLDPFGPRRAHRGSQIGGGEWVWGFMRWNWIQALLQYGHADRAVELAQGWAQAELESGLRASEVFSHSTATGITGEGYVWTAARASRALSYGLFGIQLKQDGLKICPQLPSAWPEMSLQHLNFRGRILNITCRRGDPISQLNGRPWSGPVIRETDLDQQSNHLILSPTAPSGSWE